MFKMRYRVVSSLNICMCVFGHAPRHRSHLHSIAALCCVESKFRVTPEMRTTIELYMFLAPLKAYLHRDAAANTSIRHRKSDISPTFRSTYHVLYGRGFTGRSRVAAGCSLAVTRAFKSEWKFRCKSVFLFRLPPNLSSTSLYAFLDYFKLPAR
jgi:hypothetical protein